MLVVKIEGDNIGGLTHLLAKTCFYSGYFVQSFTLPSRGYVKFDKKPFTSRQEEYPDFLLITEDRDKKSLQTIIKHAKEKSIIIINTKEKPKSPLIKKRKLRLYMVDTTQVLDSTRQPEPDTVMLGAFVKHCVNLTAKGTKMAISELGKPQEAADIGMRSVR